MPENGTKGSGGITTGITRTTIDGTTAKMAGIGVGGLKGMKCIVPFYKLHREQQRAYWKYRHEHPDGDDRR